MKQQAATPVSVSDLDSDLLWTPVVEELQQFGMKGTAGMSLFGSCSPALRGTDRTGDTLRLAYDPHDDCRFFLKRNKSDKRRQW